MSPRFDYTSMGFITFDALCRPVTQIPPGGDTYFVEDFTLAVSGAAGSAVIVAAKHGLKSRAVGGVGNDDMGDWVLMKLAKFGIDTSMMARCEGFSTSSSIVTTRPDGARPALHKRGATDGFYIGDDQIDDLLDTRILRTAAGKTRTIIDTISDNAANAGIVMGDARHDPKGDLRWIGAIVKRDGVVEETGLGAGVLDDPVTGIIWLARRMHQYGQRIEPGQIILSGSFIRAMECPSGAHIDADFGPFGHLTCTFA